MRSFAEIMREIIPARAEMRELRKTWHVCIICMPFIGEVVCTYRAYTV